MSETTSTPRESILVVDEDPSRRNSLVALLASANHIASGCATAEEASEILQHVSADLVLLRADLSNLSCCNLLSELKGSAATSSIRVMLLLRGDAAERARGLDLGADDALSEPWTAGELLARVRAQLREKRAQEDWREKARLAEQGQQIAHTAFEALAVTEKMTRDATSLDRRLKVGAAITLVLVVIMAGLYLLFQRSARRETRRAYSVIAQLERGVAGQQDLLDAARRLRDQFEQQAGTERGRLQKESADLRARIASGSDSDVNALRKQLSDTDARLRRMETESRAAEGVIRTSASSVCLIHVSVAFRDKESGERLRYLGLNPKGEPIEDSEGKPVFTLTGRGPEVRADFFGTGFIATSGGRILTNRHVAEPWWKNDELESMAQEGMEAVIAELHAYFPDTPHGVRIEIQKLSNDADLAVLQGDVRELQRAPLALDPSSAGTVSGQPVVAVGYATGVAAILARAGEDAAQSILASTNGTPQQVLAEVARRNLVRPLATQGHIGDVLPDKIVFDAQTTSGGSGGPLFNQDGKVIGVTFAVVRGFGGSNFAIPIRLAVPLLRP